MPFYDVDRNNVESVYLLLHTLETVTVLPEKRASAADLIVNVKRAIRSFNRNSTTSAHIVKDYGIDGYIELYRFPDWLDAASKDEVESYFDSHRREYYTPQRLRLHRAAVHELVQAVSPTWPLVRLPLCRR